MLSLQSSAKSLTISVTQIQQEFNNTGSELLALLSQLNTLQSERDNIGNILTSFIKCQSIITKMVQAKEHIESNSHYAAMALLESIQKEYNNNLTIKPLVKFLQSWIPLQTYKLLDAVRVDSKVKIDTIRLDISLLGQTILRRLAKVLTMDYKDLKIPNTNIRICTLNPSLSIISIYGCSIKLRFDKWIKDGELDSMIPQNFIDEPPDNGITLLDRNLSIELGDIYKAYHIHYKLNQEYEFNEFYRLARDTFLPHIFEEVEEMMEYQGLASVLPYLISSIVGFFTIECLIKQNLIHYHNCHQKNKHKQKVSDNVNKANTNIANSSNEANATSASTVSNIFSDTEMSILWDRSINYLHAFISRHIQTVSTSEQILQIKEELLLLSELVNDDLFNLRSHGIFEIIRYMWNSFESIQVTGVIQSVSYALKNCAFQPFYVDKYEVFLSEIKAYNLDFISLDQSNSNIEFHSNPHTPYKNSNMSTQMTLDALEEDLDIGIGIKNKNTTKNHSDVNSNDSNSNQSIISIHENVNNYDSKSHGPPMSPEFMGQTFPFSEVVPIILRELHLTVTRFFIFASKNPHLGECILSESNRS